MATDKSKRIEYVSDDRQSDLSQQFSNLIEVHHIEDDESYKTLAISVFDHWLNDSEARDLLAIDKSESSDEPRRNSALNGLRSIMAQSTECLSYEIVERNGHEYPMFYRFNTSQDLCKYFSQSPYGVSAKFHFKIVLPKLSALYFEGHDFTNYLYYKDDNHIRRIRSWIADAGLHVLES
ncbi:hypothetical protein [Granulosicoccus antarcticus]|uniref:hypothetical protein n=1 Tax=Granulosicoccus antarcticus TaxID=437505 RepID=UPI0012FE60E8|nr:hypothetical protein [Granulosicoccus antarcticus]